ncbi:polysaccharide deacetylase family protein [Nostoc sp.]|uniref:polysaccharide deacetylase family protein n=1 Tax=Nostoc sp. TaxID=1180 RepID=UPI002FF89D2D
MRIPGLGRLQRVKQQLQRRLASKSLILMYHRVAEVDLDPWSLCVTPQHFAEHLEVLQKYAYPISLQQLAQAHRHGNIPHRAVAITFDDGYADNLHHAKPLLERYGIPATVFISTGYIGKQREFWWDELEWLLLQPQKLPEKFSLKIKTTTHHWELGTAADCSEDDYDRDRHPWEAKPGSRLFFYYSLWQLLQSLPESDRLKALDEISAWAMVEPIARKTHCSLLPEELLALEQGELVEIGAHTVTHPFLSAHSLAFQRHEIQQSKADLEKILNRPVTSFAYPHGDYTTETVNLISEVGFACACSCIQDIVWRESDCFQLPRFGVENWNGEEFAKQLSRWFND